jgi:hypothetical protein
VAKLGERKNRRDMTRRMSRKRICRKRMEVKREGTMRWDRRKEGM